MSGKFIISILIGIAFLLATASAEPEPNESDGVARNKSEQLEQAKLEQAISQHEETIRNHPDDYRSRVQLGICLLAAKRNDEALAHIRAAVRLNSSDPDYHVVLAKALCVTRSYDEAAAEFEQAIKMAPDNFQYSYDYAVMRLNLCQYDKAVDGFTQCLKIKDELPARFGRIIALNHSRGYAMAVDECSHILRGDPINQRALAYRAYAQMRQGNYDDAINDALKAKAMGGEFTPVAYIVIGGINLQRDKIADAIENLSEAIEAVPKEPLARILRAICHVNQRNYDQAIDDLDHAISTAHSAVVLNLKLDGYGWQVYKLRATVNLVYRDRNIDAIDSFTKAIELNDKDAECYALRGMAYSKQAEWKDAISDVTKAYNMAPENDLAAFAFVTVSASCPNADIRDSKRALQAAMSGCSRNNWTNPLWVHALAAAYSENDEYEQAVLLAEGIVDKAREGNSKGGVDVGIWWSLRLQFNMVIEKVDAMRTLEHFRSKKPYHEIAWRTAGENRVFSITK